MPFLLRREAPLREPLPYREPYVFSFRRPGRSFLARFFAHLLIRLLILAPFPPHVQAAAALLPVSILWGLVEPLGRQVSEGVKQGVWGPPIVALDPEGNETLLREPEDQETTYAYDELGKLLSVTQPGNLVTSHAYDATRNRISQTDANAHVVTMAYDDLNRLTTMTQDPGGLNLVTSHQYDENGNETLLTDPKGQRVTSTYDELNRVKTKTYAFATGDPYRPWRHTTGIVYTHDANNNLLEQRESVASGTDPPSATVTITRTFDDFNRLLSETATLPDGGAKTLALTYWLNGLRKTSTDAESGLVSYTYDGQNRLESETSSLGTTRYTYFGDDLLESLTEPDGSVATHAYDKADRLVSLTTAKAGTPISTYLYTYDANGNRLSQVETNGPAEQTSYAYDALNRLTTVSYPADAVYPQGRRVEYGYDAVGNRTSEITRNPATQAVLASKTASFDALNRLRLLTDDLDPSKTTAFGYDPNGNQTSKQVGTGEPVLYRYDVRDKLLEAAQGANILERFQYDAEGRLLKKIGEDGIRQYVYDQTSRLAEYDETGARVAKWTYGSDRLISLEHRTEGTRFYHLDGLGSVTTLTDPAGEVTSRLHLDTWGVFRDPNELNTSANRFAFTGFSFEREVGLYNAKARWYDAETGRFTTQDTFLGNIDEPPSLHRYQYANANPTRYVDPTGQSGEVATGYEWFYGSPLERFAKAIERFERPVETKVKELAGGLLVGAFGIVFGQLNQPGHNPTPEYQESLRRTLPQPQTDFEARVAIATDLALTASPLGARLAARRGGVQVAGETAPTPLEPLVAAFEPASANAPKAVTIIESWSQAPTATGPAGAGPLVPATAGFGARPTLARVEGTSLIGRGQRIVEREGGTFIVGDRGQVLNASGDLTLTAAPRDFSAQAQLPGKEAGDQAGHLLGARFGFEGGRENLVPMARTVNLSSYKKLENHLGRLVSEGHQVSMDVHAVYGANPLRPERLVVTYTVDGRSATVVLPNPAPTKK